MNRVRTRAGRMALYLECAGVIPIVDGSELRRSARLEGRRVIRHQGIAAAAVRLLPVPMAVCDLTKLNPEQRRRVRAAYRKKLRQRSPEILPCPKCRIASGMPKRSWRSRELAEAARARQKDTRLHVCPYPAPTELLASWASQLTPGNLSNP